jgi:hypothetical protein
LQPDSVWINEPIEGLESSLHVPLAQAA